MSAVLPEISLNVPNNLSPRWGVDTVSVSGNVTGANTGDTVTVSWDDGTTSSGISISGNLWGPVNHIYGMGTSGNHKIVAQLYSSSSTLLVSSNQVTLNVQRHTTSLSLPTLNVPAVKWGKTFSVIATLLTDTTTGQGLAGKTITFSGNGTTGTPSRITNNKGGLGAPLAITSPGIYNVGKGNVFANFAGDANYLGSSSNASTIQITKHSTALSKPAFDRLSVALAHIFTADVILTDLDASSMPVTSESVRFSGNGTAFVKKDFSNSTGHVETTLVAAGKVGLGQVSAIFEGDGNYLASGPSTSGITITPDPIKHIIVIMQENHSYDNYFGTFSGANGIPAGTCMPLDPSNPGLGCVQPFHTHNFTEPDLQHNFTASTKDVNGGLMNGFMAGEENDTRTMAYINGTEIPNYWTFAKNYVLADNFFSSVQGWSMPNHWYSVAGQAPLASIPTFIGGNTSETVKDEYLREANETDTVADLFMNGTAVSWKYYDLNFGNIVPGGYANAKNNGYVFDYWNPFAAKANTYTASYVPHFVPHTQIFADLQNNGLPQVSWVIPPDYYSEHPPASSRVGMIWTTDVVDAIMNSPYWNSTAIIITWDDYGGFYDHVPPLQIDQYGSGIRVPTIIISPYAKQGFVDHTSYIFESMLKFIEWKFDMISLTPRDTNANNLLNAFDFAQSPRLPSPIPISANDLTQLRSNYLVPPTGHVGETVKFIGNGFSNLERAAVTYDNAPLGSALANGTGSLNFNFRVPPSAAGCHWVVDTYPSGKVVFGRGLINHCYIVTPSVSASPTVGKPGDLVKINGTGFAAASSISIKYDGVNQTTSATDSTGSFAASLAIPKSSDGGHTILASDSSGNSAFSIFAQNTGRPIVVVNAVSNTLPRWSVDKTSASGSSYNFAAGDTVTLSWGDGTNTTGIPISGNLWGPVFHVYASTATTNPNQVIAELVSNVNTIKATSNNFTITVKPHGTALSSPIVVGEVKWGKNYNVTNVILTDTANGRPISGKIITFSGNGTTGSQTGKTNTSGELTLPVTITAPGIFNVGIGNVTASFEGNANFAPSFSSTTIQITKHATTVSNPTFDVPSVLWGDRFTVNSKIIDADSLTPINAKLTFSGNGTITKSDFTNSSGVVETSLTAPDFAGAGHVRVFFGGNGNYLPSSSASTITLLKHATSITTPVLDGSSVKWAKVFNVTGTVLADPDLGGAGISGKTITFSGTAVSGAPFGTSNSTGGLASKVTITASTNVGTGRTVIASFAGDSRYLASTSKPVTITINQHATSSALDAIKVVPWSRPTKFPATLIDTDDGTAIQGRTVHFDGTGAIGVADQITNSTGQAIGRGTSPSTVATGWTVQAHFAGDLLYASSDSLVTKYGTSKHPTFTSLIISAGTLAHGAIYKVTGLLKDSLIGTALDSKTITFSASPPIVINPTTTNSTGSYTVSHLVAPSTPGTYSIQAFFGADPQYSASNSPSKTITVT